MLKEIEETGTLIALEAQCGEISMENAFSKLPEFIAQARSFLGEKIGNPLTMAFAGNRPQDFVRAVSKTTYTDFKMVTVYVPQGMNVPYLTLQKTLQDSAAHCLTIEERALDPLIKWLGERLGNPSALTSVTSSFKIPSNDVEKLEKAYHDCFIVNGQKQSEIPYQKAISRQGDWNDIVAGVEGFEKQLTSDLHKRLMEKMSRLDDLLATLVRRIQETPEAYKFSSTALADLASTVYATARQLEFYGLTTYRAESYNTAVKDTIKKLQVFVK